MGIYSIINNGRSSNNYIKEHIEAASDINGSGGLDRYINDYEGWLEKLELDYNRVPNEEKVPARTFFW